MEANELMIGNYVNIPGLFGKSNIVGIVESISKEEIITNICEANVAMFEPIPLTEEWLIKFGFEKIGTNFRLLYDFEQGFREFILWFNVNEKTYNVKNNNYFNEIKTVHQLQNLFFCLTGKELTPTNL